MEIQYRRLDEITPYENNPRVNDDGVEAVAESIKAFGFKVPMVLDKDGVIICGHTRYKAAQKLGIDQVPCVIADDLTEKEAKAFRLADNKVSDFSIFDNKKLLEELDGLDDIFTGLELGGLFDSTLDEDDGSALEDNAAGVQYEIVFKSESEERIKAIAAAWEAMDDEK